MKLQATQRELLILRDFLNQRSNPCEYQYDDIVNIEFEIGRPIVREDGTTYGIDAPVKYAPKHYRAQSLSEILRENRRR